MARSRYHFTEPDSPHFLTCTVVEWLPVFTRPAAVQILLDSWSYQQQHGGLRLYGFVILENHLHAVAQAEDLPETWSRFKSFTARRLIELLEVHHAEALLKRMRFARKAQREDRDYQLWQEGSHPQLIVDEDMLRQKLDYMHRNPVERGYVDRAEHWRWSSARCYAGEEGVIEVFRAW